MEKFFPAGLKNSDEVISDFSRFINEAPFLFVNMTLPDLNIVSLNQAMADSLKTDVKTAIGRSLKDFLPPDILKKRMEMTYDLMKKAQHRKRDSIDFVDQRESRYFHNFIMPEKGSDPSWVVIVSFDITHEKASEKALKEAQERLNLAVMGSREGLWDWDITTNELYLSPRWKEMLGYRDEELPNEFKTFENLIDPRDRSEIFESINLYLNNELDVWDKVFRMLHKNGGSRWIRARGHALRDKDGKPFRMAGSHSDITHIKETEERLRESEVRNRMILENVLDTLIIHDTKGVIKEVSRNVKRLLGYTPEELAGQPLTSIHPPHYRSVIEKNASEKDWDNGVQIFENRLLKKDGTVVDVEISKSSVSYNGEMFVHAFIRDITKRKKAEKIIKEENRKNRQNLELARRLQQRFIPKGLPLHKNLTTQAVYIPNEILSGDFFNLVEDGSKIIFIIADCTGHGFEAAMDSIFIKTVTDNHIEILKTSPAEFLQKVNKDICGYLLEERLVTIMAGVIDIDKKTLVFANANSEPLYLINQGGIEVLHGKRNLHVGYDPELQYEDERIDLGENDILFTCSDSVREIMVSQDKIFNKKGLETILKKFKPGIKSDTEYFLNEIESTAGSFPLRDDFTMLMFEFVSTLNSQYYIYNLGELHQILKEIKKSLETYSFSNDDEELITIACEEMIINSVVHGNQNDPSKYVKIKLSVNGLEASISIEDQGKGFHPEDVPDPTDETYLKKILAENKEEVFTHGRGIFLTQKYMDRVSYNEKGNQVNIIKRKHHYQTKYI